VFREKITGSTADRPQLKKLMKALAGGDVVITPAVDRLSRDTTDLLVIAGDMQRAGAGIRSLAEPFLDTTSDFAEIIFAILGVAAKLERRRILERKARGRADAPAKGVKFGRKPILTPHQQKEARARIAAGETQRSVARSYNVGESIRFRGRCEGFGSCGPGGRPRFAGGLGDGGGECSALATTLERCASVKGAPRASSSIGNYTVDIGSTRSSLPPTGGRKAGAP
jgi:hypothetical protein